LGTIVPKYQYLSQEMVQQIVNETKAKRELSQLEIAKLASRLNLFLGLHERGKQTSSEPTFLQLRAQIKKLHNALNVLKSALLPATEQVSLRKHLIQLGELYAETRGPHPKLPAVNDYRSGERLDEMISSVSQVLEWMNKTPANMEEPRNWWVPPFFIFSERGRRFLSGVPIDAHRRAGTEELIGGTLPFVYEETFQTRYGVSRPPGPGGRFVLAVLRLAGISNDDNRPFVNATVIKYRQNYLRREGRSGTSSQPSVLEDEQKKISRSSNDG
jgi:hypothetical protein